MAFRLEVQTVYQYYSLVPLTRASSAGNAARITVRLWKDETKSEPLCARSIVRPDRQIQNRHQLWWWFNFDRIWVKVKTCIDHRQKWQGPISIRRCSCDARSAHPTSSCFGWIRPVHFRFSLIFSLNCNLIFNLIFNLFFDLIFILI